MECFICKKSIDNAELGETKNVVLPDGKQGYVHIHHPGVVNLEEAIPGMSKKKKF